MKYLRIFKAKKPIGQLNESERSAFAKDFAENILENIISSEIRAVAIDLRDALPKTFQETKEDFIRICEVRQNLKTIEQQTLDKVFEKHALAYFNYLNSIRVIDEKNLLEVSTEYLTLNWIDAAIHKKSLDIYKRMLEIRSSLTKLNLWAVELEEVYRSASFGENAHKPNTFVNCSVVIKQKDKNKIFNSSWDRDFWPAINSDTYNESLVLGSTKIWKALSDGMIPDLQLVFREFSGWLK
jgi:hypothetical protein